MDILSAPAQGAAGPGDDPAPGDQAGGHRGGVPAALPHEHQRGAGGNQRAHRRGTAPMRGFHCCEYEGFSNWPIPSQRSLVLRVE